MSELFFTQDHEWVLLEDGVATVGITDYAQSSLGEVVYIELPEVSSEYSAGDSVAIIESVKAASDIYAPVTGVVIAVNETLESVHELINEDAESEAWIFKMRPGQSLDTSIWLNREEYQAFVDG